MSMVLTPLTWVERAEVFVRLAKTKQEAGDIRGYEAALLSVKTARMMAVEEGEVTQEERDALDARDRLALVEDTDG